MLSYEKSLSLARQWAEEPQEVAELAEKLQNLEAVYDNSYTEDIERALQEYRETVSNFGKVTFEGKTYTLTADADFTGRCLEEKPNYQDQGENGEYWFEMSAPAVDADGNEYTVYWMFYCDNPDRELDSYDYDKVERVVED